MGIRNLVRDYLIIIDHEAREIMHLLASVHLSVCPSVRLFALSWLNRSTYDRYHVTSQHVMTSFDVCGQKY